MSKINSFALADDKYMSSKKKGKLDDKYKINISKNTFKEYIDAGQSSSTKNAYAADLRHFFAHGGRIPCKPKLLAKYLAKAANYGLSVATLERRLSAIHKAHIKQKLQSPVRSETVKAVMHGIRRKRGVKQRQVQPLTRDYLLLSLEYMSHDRISVKAVRDRALLLIGFASAMRRSELVGVQVKHLNFFAKGLEIEIPLSKTDQESRGRIIFIPKIDGDHCPVEALKKWLNLSKIDSGAVFRAVTRFGNIAQHGLSAQTVALIIKEVVAHAGLNPENVSGHSLRSGYCTSAAEQGMQLWQIRQQTGHKSDATLLGYIRSSSRKNIPSVL